MARQRTYKVPFLLYHWSPSSRRESILKNGLRIKSRPVQCRETWPHICFSDSPSFAWALSARFINEESSWDLWMCWSSVAKLPIVRRDDIKGRPTEFRIRENIPKSKIWFVGTRRHEPRKKIIAEKNSAGVIFLK